MICTILDDGTLSFADKTGAPVTERVIEVAKKQNRNAIVDLIERKCDEINRQIEALGTLDHDTPDSKTCVSFTASALEEPRPSAPLARRPGWWEGLLPRRRRKIDDVNRDAQTHFRNALAAWEATKAHFDRQAGERRELLESLIYTDTAAMERLLQENLLDVVWPRERTVAFDIQDGGRCVALDVDLPEIEDMPNKLAAVPARELK
jgi:hypothetical protein